MGIEADELCERHLGGVVLDTSSSDVSVAINSLSRQINEKLARNTIRRTRMAIRDATLSDVRQIAIAHVESWRTTYVGQVPQPYLDQLSVSSRELAWSEALSNPKHRMLVAEQQGVIFGFSSFGASRDEYAA